MDASAKRVMMPVGSFFRFEITCAGRRPAILLVSALIWVAALLPLAALAERLELAPLTVPRHPGWVVKQFSGETRYTVVREDGLTLLQAQSNATASGLVHEGRIGLAKTPWINWRWKVGNVLADVDERSKAGDDYPARVYVIAKGGLAFWQTKALSYVWASRQPKESGWPNAFTKNAWTIAVESGGSLTGRILWEKRNIREDWKHAFGEDITVIDAVAIMTDTDNSGQSALAWYDTPFFSFE